jgi:hypothetical protein
MNHLLIISIIVIFLVLAFVNMYLKKEEFRNQKENFENYLYPIKGLGGECKEQGLKPAYMPSICVVDGKLKSFSNCKCMNDKGECKVCYPEIKKDQKNASVIYNPNDYNKDTQ